jgi:Asp-tRNA(Asn)/Glu-tRNA(Gln) amidotransferase A subunit family amidase
MLRTIAAVTLAAGFAAVVHGQAREPFSVAEQDIVALKAAMDAGRITSRAIVDQYLERIRKYDKDGPGINAFITLNPRAREAADALDEERRTRGVRGPLHGIPIVVKDNYETAGMPTTGASIALKGFETGRDAFVVRRLLDAGVVIVGKTNLHELAYGITTISSLGGQTRNPYDPTRNPGGSSGGTGAAIAASFAAAGLGTDTCGSIRLPAAHNNLLGLRPTMGLVSRDGIIPLALTQDTGGPIARTPTDLALILDAIAGVDSADPATEASRGRVPKTYLTAMSESSLGDVRVGVLTPLFGSAPEDAEVGDIVRAAVKHLARMGAEVIDFDIPGLQELLQGTSVINAEFKFDLLDFLAKRPGAPVKSLDEILQSGRFHKAVEGVFRRANEVASRDTDAYRAALAKREMATGRVVAAMASRGITALAYPSIRRKAAPIGEAQAGSNCQLSATTGLPAITLQAGFTPDGLPVGLELLAGAFAEGQLLRIASSYAREVSYRRPPKSTP